MLAKRIIPCLDVTAGRVVKGVNFVNLRDAGDPVELADRYNQQGADETRVPRHHRVKRRPRHHGRRSRPHSSQGLHPAHCRRWDPQRCGRPIDPQIRSRQSLHQHRRHPPP